MTDVEYHNMNNYAQLGGDDFVFTKGKDGQTIAGGFSVDSIWMKMGKSPIQTVNTAADPFMEKNDVKVSDLFSNLVVPSWVLTLPYRDSFKGGKGVRQEDSDDENDVVDDDLHDKLLDIVREYNVKKNAKKIKLTRKKRSTTVKHSKTKKHK
jgi:hypothetical protein